MKYIRTKDGRITTLKDELMDIPGLWVLGGKENILKISDNIEELFDEYVCIGSHSYCQRYVKHSIEEALRKKKWLERAGYTCNIYGDIWIDEEGLIHKAKMKGILPNGEIDWELK